MTTLATRIAHDHQPTPTGCTCGKRLVGSKCSRGSLMPFVVHVAEVTQGAAAAEIEAWSARETGDGVLTQGAWSDGVRYGLCVGSEIARNPL